MVSRLKDKIVTKAGAKAVLGIYGFTITEFQEGKDYWQSTPRIENNQSTTRTLNLKTDGHLELLAGSSKIWSSK